MCPVLAHQCGGQIIDVLQMFGKATRTLCIARPQDFTIQGAYLFDTAQDTSEPYPVILGDPALPATLPLQRNQVQTGRYFVGDTLQICIYSARNEGARNRGLFQNVTRIMRWERFQNALHLAGQINDAGEVCTDDFLTITLPQHRALDTLFDKVFLHRALVFEVHFGLAARHFVKWRLCDIKVPVFDQLGHLAVKERQQQRANVRTVDVRVRHDDDLMIAQFGNVEFIPANAGAQRHNEVANFLASQHAVKPRAFDVQNLTLQRQDRLGLTVTARLRRTPR